MVGALSNVRVLGVSQFPKSVPVETFSLSERAKILNEKNYCTISYFSASFLEIGGNFVTSASAVLFSQFISQ